VRQTAITARGGRICGRRSVSARRRDEGELANERHSPRTTAQAVGGRIGRQDSAHITAPTVIERGWLENTRLPQGLGISATASERMST